MIDDPLAAPERTRKRKLAEVGLLLLGLVLGQAFLYGPSLAGSKVLLPLDILAAPGAYLPIDPDQPVPEPHNRYLSDLVCVMEPARQFAHAELSHGRLPTWVPYHFAGAPFLWPSFSPFLLLQASARSPGILAWSQLLAALVAGVGAYRFFRRSLRVSFWPAVIGGWCYPLTAFFVYWQGFTTALAVAWLPWVLLAVDATLQDRSRLAPLGLVFTTLLTLVSGQLDTAGQVLLCSGLFALWRLAPTPRPAETRFRLAARLGFAWALGFLLAAPYLWPVLEYSRTGARMAQRGAGQEDRPPAGLSALPQVVLPKMYGTLEHGSYRYANGNEMESSAAAYVGVVGTLLFAPLAWCSRRHRRDNWFWTALAVLGLAWCLNLPGLVPLLRLPGLNLLSHNRFTFAAAFSLLALIVVGLDVWRAGPLPWRNWFWPPIALAIALGAWCGLRIFVPPAPVESQLTSVIVSGQHVGWIQDLEDVRRVQDWFNQQYLVYAILCGIALAGWFLVRSHTRQPVRWFPLLAIVLVGELLWFGYGRNPQCDPALYYPPLPALDAIARAEPGRVIGIHCLPANFAATRGLHDIRGYDAVDPARLMDLLAACADASSGHHEYAYSQNLVPQLTLLSNAVTLPPLLSLLNVRYTIWRGSPPAGVTPTFQAPDYWVITNRSTAPRVFVPRRVMVVEDAPQRLALLSSAQFDAQEFAFVESPIQLPGECRGTATLVAETPTHLTVAVQAETPALVVLADLWDRGWHAWFNGRPVPILRTDHALRGVPVPAGAGTLEFRYQPGSLAGGLRLAMLGAALAVIWAGLRLRQPRAAPAADPGTAA